MRTGIAAAVGLFTAFMSPFVPAAQGAEDELTFRVHCAACHADTPAAAGTPNERAPTRIALRQFTAEAVLNALVNGKMQVQGSVLNEAQRRLVSEFATGKTLGAAGVGGVAVVNRCAKDRSMGSPARGASWNGHGNGLAATRFQPARTGRLTAADLPRLKLKWAFGYTGVGAARAQPAVAGGKLFVASENGEVHRRPQSGCKYWTSRPGRCAHCQVKRLTSASGRCDTQSFRRRARQQLRGRCR